MIIGKTRRLWVAAGTTRVRPRVQGRGLSDDGCALRTSSVDRLAGRDDLSRGPCSIGGVFLDMVGSSPPGVSILHRGALGFVASFLPPFPRRSRAKRDAFLRGSLPPLPRVRSIPRRGGGGGVPVVLPARPLPSSLGSV
eukprot:scaffold616_cov306-Pavlova_lutheri.AAC.35